MKYGITKGFADYYNARKDVRGRTIVTEAATPYKVALGKTSINLVRRDGIIHFNLGDISMYFAMNCPEVLQFLGATGVELPDGEYYHIGAIELLLDIPRGAKDAEAIIRNNYNKWLDNRASKNMWDTLHVREIQQHFETVLNVWAYIRPKAIGGAGRTEISRERRDLERPLDYLKPAIKELQTKAEKAVKDLVKLLKDIERREMKFQREEYIAEADEYKIDMGAVSGVPVRRSPNKVSKAEFNHKYVLDKFAKTTFMNELAGACMKYILAKRVRGDWVDFDYYDELLQEVEENISAYVRSWRGHIKNFEKEAREGLGMK